jgi:hypothetical protein
MKNLVSYVAISVIGLTLAGTANAAGKTANGSLGDPSTASDLLSISCSNNGSGAPHHLFATVTDTSPGAPSRFVSVQIRYGLHATTSTDTTLGDNKSSTSLALTGGKGPYNVGVFKSNTGVTNYQLHWECRTSKNVVTGTGSAKTLQNQ